MLMTFLGVEIMWHAVISLEISCFRSLLILQLAEEEEQEEEDEERL